MKSAKKTTRSAQTGLRLGPDLMEAVRLSASKTGISISEEIRRRLEASFELDDVPPAARELMDAVAWLTWEVSRSFGRDWNRYPQCATALVHAVTTWIEMNQPAEAMESDDGLLDPKEIGVAAAKLYTRIEAEKKRESERMFKIITQLKGGKS